MSGDRSRDPGDRSGRDPRFCSDCGDAIAPTANYCSSCGTAVSRPRSTIDRRFGRRPSATPPDGGGTTATNGGGAAATNGGGTADRAALERRIARAAADGWELEHDFGDRVVMVRRTVGDVGDHLVVALVTVWWTMGIGNALYGAYRYVTDAERMVLRAERSASGTDDGTARRRAIARVTALLCWLVAAVVAAIGVLVSASTIGLVLFAVAALFAAAGVGSLPSVRTRLDRRRTVTANGRIRSVDERAIVAPDRPCAVCADPVDPGVERTYRESVYLAGIPLSTSEGHNYYCRACANAERAGAPETHGPEPNRATESAADRGTDRDAGPGSDADRVQRESDRDRA